MTTRHKVVLIGGTSHVGKSTLGTRLAEELRWNYLSTDQLARHPGRPWKAGDQRLPDDVIDHYSELSTPQLVDSVLSHYRSNVWPIIEAIVRSRLNNPFDLGLVLEGSALLPDLIADAGHDRTTATWLTAPRDLITARIRQGSAYEARAPAEQQLIDAFLERTLAMDEIFVRSAEASGQEVLDTTSDDVFETLLSLARRTVGSE